MHTATPILELGIIVGAATLASVLCHSIRIPTVVGFLLAGTLIGPYGTRWVQTVPGAEWIIELGGTLLLFTVGLEFSFRKFLQYRKLFFGLGSVQVLGTTLLIALPCLFFLKWGISKSIFMGFLISLSSTALSLKMLEENRELQSPYGNCTVGILLFQDLAFIPMVLAMPLLAGTSSTSSFSVSLQSVGELLVVCLLLFLSTRYLVPRLLERVVKSGSREIFFFCVLFLIFGTGYALESIGLSIALGAFMVGMVLCDSPYGKQAAADIIPFRDIFLGIFFLSVGMLLDLPFLWDKLFLILALGLACFLIKVMVATLAVRVQKFPIELGLMVGIAISQVGEFSFLLAPLGHKMGLISMLELQYFLCLSALSLLISPSIHKWATHRGWIRNLNLSHIFKTLPIPTTFETSTPRVSSHTVLIGFGWAGQNLASALKTLAIPYRILEMNFSQVKNFQSQGEPIYWGDASQPEVLEQVDLRSARLVVISVTGAETSRRILENIRRVRPDIPVILRLQYLRELENLQADVESDLVVAEFETTIEILSRALKSYGVSSKQLHEFIDGAHQQLRKLNFQFSKSLKSTVSLPGWETISLIRPVTLNPGSPACKKTLWELDLRSHFGVLIVSVFRKGLGTSVPTPDFVLEQGDILHMIGEPSQLDSAEAFLNSAQIS